MNNNEFEMKDEYDMSQAKRGPIVPPAPNQTRITIRVDTDLLDWFRDQMDSAGGGNYQTMINEALREYIQHHQEPIQTTRRLETTLRRVIREELQVVGLEAV